MLFRDVALFGLGGYAACGSGGAAAGENMRLTTKHSFAARQEVGEELRFSPNGTYEL